MILSANTADMLYVAIATVAMRRSPCTYQEMKRFSQHIILSSGQVRDQKDWSCVETGLMWNHWCFVIRHDDILFLRFQVSFLHTADMDPWVKTPTDLSTDEDNCQNGFWQVNFKVNILNANSEQFNTSA